MRQGMIFGVTCALLWCSSAGAQVWRVTYEMTNAQLSIENTPLNGAGDGVHEVGPGAITLEFDDNGGAIGDGEVRIAYFILEQEFQAGTDGAVVDTDITSSANFDQSTPFTIGTLSGETISFTAPVPYRADGTNTCNGGLCPFAGFDDGETQDIDRTDDVVFADFVFQTGGPQEGAGFSMGRVSLPGNDQADTFLTFETREIRRVFVDSGASDPCQSYPSSGAHTGDLDCDQAIGLDDTLRIIQLFNAGRFSCGAGEDDAYQLGVGNTVDCARHDADFATPAFRISLSELLRVVQLFNLGGAVPCGENEDGFCASAEA